MCGGRPPDGLEPWKITAEFDSAGHAARAEWSWNMHDNAVNCLNATARKLIGEQDTPTEGHAEKQVDQEFFIIEFAGRFRTLRTYRTDGVRLECSGTGCTASHEYQDHR